MIDRAMVFKNDRAMVFTNAAKLGHVSSGKPISSLMPGGNGQRHEPNVSSGLDTPI